MKKITPVLAILFFVLPSISSAAALTQQQSTSLIAVVQSSPGTPASAFVSLITAFSNITTAQASSLITVVQAAPSVPATAFVDLLTSFTDDTLVVPSTMPPTTSPDVCSNIEGIQTTPPVGMTAKGNVCVVTTTQAVVPIPVTVTPVVQDQPIYFGSATPAPIVDPVVEPPKKITAKLRVESYGTTPANGIPYRDIIISLKDGGAPVTSMITLSAPDGYFMAHDGTKPRLQYTFPNSETGLTATTYVPETKGNRDVTVSTTLGLTATVNVRGDLRD